MFVPSLGKSTVGLSGCELNSSMRVTCRKSVSACRCGLEEITGMRYLEAWSRDRNLAPVLIWRIARAEEYARSLIPGYSTSKVETIISYGGLWSESPSNHRITPARRTAESMASGSVMFRRTEKTQRALSAFRSRRVSRFRTGTRNPGPLRGMCGL